MTNRDLNYSRLFDVSRWSDHPEVDALVDRLYEAHIRSLEPTDRKPTQDKNPCRKALKTLLIDLYVGWVDDPLLVTAFARSNRAYRQGQYNELHISAKVKDVVDQLVVAGYLLNKDGFKDRREGGSGRVSRIWATTPVWRTCFERPGSGSRMSSQPPRIANASSLRRGKTRTRRRS
jgi:hypothetical protein